MSAARLLELYDRVSEAPDAIPRLRKFLLDIAMRGRLVKQQPSDEPASELLKKIAAERSRIGKARRFRMSKAKPNVLVIGQNIHELPSNWAWAAVGDVFLYDAGTKRSPKDIDKEAWLLELEDIEKDTGRLLARIKVSDRAAKSTKSEFQVGDILYGKLRPYLNKVIVADKPGLSTTEIVAIRPFVPLCSHYCALAFRRPEFVEYVTRLGQGTKMPRLRTEDALVAPFPLPPRAEQDRIVAKVNELMELFDQIEQRVAERQQARRRLLEASIDAAL